MGYKFFPSKFNNFLFQQQNRVASDFLDFDWDIRGLSTQNTSRNNNRPKYSGMNLVGGIKVVNVVLTDAGRDRDDLVIAMDTGSQNQLPLYSLDELGNEFFCMAKCVGLNPESVGDGQGEDKAATFGYIFEVDDPTWISVKEYTDVWNILADEETHTITVLGNQFTRPVFEIIPGAPVGYYPYTQYAKNYNPIPVAQTEAIDITNGGWNTAALVAAGKMRADGFDILVFMDGAQIPYFFGGGGINTATTRIFVRAVWKPGQNTPLRTALNNTDIDAKIQWVINTYVVTTGSGKKKKKVTKTVLSKLPPSGIVRVGTEEISYTNLNPTLCEADIVSRNIRNTTIAAHAVGDVCWWVEHDIKIIYGNAAAEEPINDETFMPIFDLDTSVNAVRVYPEFADTDNLQAGSFIRQILNNGQGKLNRVYTVDGGALPEVDPAVVAGMEIKAYDVQGRANPETADLAWQLFHPAGITKVTATGKKYKALSTTTWPATAALESSPNGVNWTREWNEAVPASAATPTAITNTAAEVIAAGNTFIRFHFAGSVNGESNNLARLQMDSAVIELEPTNLIQVGLNGESANYQFSIRMFNQTTNENIYLDYPAKQGDTLTIDTDQMKILFKGMNAIRAIDWDTIRTEWFAFKPGPNVIQYFADPTAAIQITSKYHIRAA